MSFYHLPIAMLVLVASARSQVTMDEVREAFMDDWFGDTSPPAEDMLNERQQRWFHSLGDAREGNERTSGPNCIRREYRTLSDEERNRFHDAVVAMKNTMVDDVSEYDIMVIYHKFINAPAAHAGAAFYPWHREYLMRMERSLQLHDPEVCLPYWDSTLDSYLPQVADSAMWTEDYMGNANGTVDTGPFAYWAAPPGCTLRWDELNRAVGRSGAPPFSDANLTYIWSKETYESQVCFVDCYFEDQHGSVHSLVGAHMGAVSCSPTDPVFWLHHGFIDFIWEEFRQNYQVTDPELEYPVHSNDTDIGGPGHDAYSPMLPFEYLFNIHGMSNHYVNYYHQYAPRPYSCEVDVDCGPAILWCDVQEARCKAKVMEGGSCEGLPDQACACEDNDIPTCEDDICFC